MPAFASRPSLRENTRRAYFSIKVYLHEITDRKGYQTWRPMFVAIYVHVWGGGCASWVYFPPPSIQMMTTTSMDISVRGCDVARLNIITFRTIAILCHATLIVLLARCMCEVYTIGGSEEWEQDYFHGSKTSGPSLRHGEIQEPPRTLNDRVHMLWHHLEEERMRNAVYSPQDKRRFIWASNCSPSCLQDYPCCSRDLRTLGSSFRVIEMRYMSIFRLWSLRKLLSLMWAWNGFRTELFNGNMESEWPPKIQVVCKTVLHGSDEASPAQITQSIMFTGLICSKEGQKSTSG